MTSHFMNDLKLMVQSRGFDYITAAGRTREDTTRTYFMYGILCISCFHALTALTVLWCRFPRRRVRIYPGKGYFKPTLNNSPICPERRWLHSYWGHCKVLSLLTRNRNTRYEQESPWHFSYASHSYSLMCTKVIEWWSRIVRRAIALKKHNRETKIFPPDFK